ncbi:hypothetical protein ACVITL_003850 [Rhizobium pisi]
MQVVAGCRPDARKRALEFGIGGDQRRRQKAFLHQPVFAVNIGDDRLQEVGALDEARR